MHLKGRKGKICRLICSLLIITILTYIGAARPVYARGFNGIGALWETVEEDQRKFKVETGKSITLYQIVSGPYGICPRIKAHNKSTGALEVLYEHYSGPTGGENIKDGWYDDKWMPYGQGSMQTSHTWRATEAAKYDWFYLDGATFGSSSTGVWAAYYTANNCSLYYNNCTITRYSASAMGEDFARC